MRNSQPTASTPEPEVQGEPFNAEGDGYDMARAKASGMEVARFGPNAEHWGAVAPTSEKERAEFALPEDSYVLLKGRQHETWDLAVQAENDRGYRVVKLGDRYYSVPAYYIPPAPKEGEQGGGASTVQEGFSPTGHDPSSVPAWSGGPLVYPGWDQPLSGANQGGGIGAGLDNNEPANMVLNYISKLEAPGGYNQQYGEVAFQHALNLTGMTLGEVLNLPVPEGTAGDRGRYQIIQQTLKNLVKNLGIPDNIKFTPGVQDALAFTLLQSIGWDDFMSGKLTSEEFAKRITGQWYATRDKGTVEELTSVLDKARATGKGNNPNG